MCENVCKSVLCSWRRLGSIFNQRFSKKTRSVSEPANKDAVYSVGRPWSEPHRKSKSKTFYTVRSTLQERRAAYNFQIAPLGYYEFYGHLICLGILSDRCCNNFVNFPMKTILTSSLVIHLFSDWKISECWRGHAILGNAAI